jgi:hypothetical protein
MSAKVASGDREAATVVANDPNDLKGELKRIGGSQSDPLGNVAAPIMRHLSVAHRDRGQQNARCGE